MAMGDCRWEGRNRSSTVVLDGRLTCCGKYLRVTAQVQEGGELNYIANEVSDRSQVRQNQDSVTAPKAIETERQKRPKRNRLQSRIPRWDE